MHVDGFRFDLAATLARELHDVNRLSSFFDTIHQDPTLADVKLIAEPWDVGEGGYQVGQFPGACGRSGTGKYRDTVRRFWKGDGGQLSDFAYRLTGSSDLYQFDGRKPYASINFVTAHDGFTLCDLVSYNEKHNEANGDDNEDGSDNNDCWNMGAEGPTDDAEINKLRERQMRNFLATLLLCQGVPMITGGDEIARSQRGNNNCYCQDNELTWFDWKLDAPRKRLMEFTTQLIEAAQGASESAPAEVLSGPADPGLGGAGYRVVSRGRAGGDRRDWNTEWNRSMAHDAERTGRWALRMKTATRSMDDSFLILVNAAHEGVEFTLPKPPNGTPWRQVMDTENIDDPFASGGVKDKIIAGGRSMVVFSDAAKDEPKPRQVEAKTT